MVAAPVPPRAAPLERRPLEAAPKPPAPKEAKLAEVKGPEPKPSSPEIKDTVETKASDDKRAALGLEDAPRAVAPFDRARGSAQADPAAMRRAIEANLKPVAPEPPQEVSPPSVSDARRAEIAAFVQRSAREFPADRARGSSNQANAVADALRGRSSLGALNEPEKSALLDAQMRRWTDADKRFYDQNVNYTAIHALSEQARSDPSIGRVISDDFAARAIELRASDRSNRDRAMAGTFATEALKIAGNDRGQHALVERLGPEGASKLVGALALAPERLLDGGSFAYGSATGEAHRLWAANRLLEATTKAPPSDATRAVVDTAFARMGERAFANEWPGDSKGSMAKALAHQWHPTDPGAAREESKRLYGVLQSPQGRELIANDKLTLEARLEHLTLLKQHPEWDAALLSKRDSAFDVPEVARALAEPTARQYAQLRGDAPRALSGTHLDNTIGFAMGFPPQGIPRSEAKEATAAREQAVAEGRHSYYSGDPAGKVVAPVRDAIRRIGGDDAQVTVLPVQYASADTGAVRLPLFRVQDKATGQERFVDNQGRTYQDFQDWRQNNALPPGNMTYPANGHLGPGAAALVSENTPKTVDTLGEHVGAFVDKASLVGGVVAGGAIVLGSGGLLAPAVVAGAGAWQAYRGVEQLNDRHQHGQSINPFADAGARGAWLDVGGGVLSVASLGASGVATRAAKTGSALAFPAATAAAALRVSSNAVDAGAAANAGHQLITRWDELSGGERAGLALSAGFWGAGTLAGARGPTGKLTSPFDFKAMRAETLYGHLDPKVRTALDGELQSGRTAERGLADLAVSPGFRALSKDGQLGLLEQYAKLPPEAKAAFGAEFPKVAGHPGSQKLFVDAITSGELAQLPAAKQAELLHGMGALKPDAQATFKDAWARSPHDRDSLVGLARAPGMAELSAPKQRALLESSSDVRATLAEELARHGGDGRAANTLADLAQSKGFQAMPWGDRERMLRYVGGTNDDLSTRARAALERELAAPSFKNGTPREQHDRLQRFMNDQPGIRPVMSEPAGTWAASGSAKLGRGQAVPAAPFGSGPKPATRYELEIDGRKIPVYVATARPDRGLHLHGVEDVRRAIERMPPAARAKVNEVHVDSAAAPGDAHWQRVFNDPGHRGYMTAGADGLVTIHPTTHTQTLDTMVGSLIHEAGHFDSQTRWGHDSANDPRWSDWKNAVFADRVAVSRYAKNNLDEDFAETFRLYSQVRGTPREAELRNIMPERFRILDRIWASP